mmetsp:Transcript_16362/g.22549  ORF Transcript_16362/g.22549 Transcript_16362/m.22549 type:complete len:281 (+) Transcript_16362:489-1331(+)
MALDLDIFATCPTALVMACEVRSLMSAVGRSTTFSRVDLNTSSVSTLLITSCCIVTDSTGYDPAALSAESMTASQRSYTAVAQSEASARVGVGFSIMLSIIWVAITTGLPSTRQRCTICFWMIGTSQGDISTPRSPLATMMPSDSFTISSRYSIAEGFSSFAMSRSESPARALNSSISSGRCTNESATQSTSSVLMNSKSRLSFGVSGEMGSTMDGVLTPFLFDSLPPITTSHTTAPSVGVVAVAMVVSITLIRNLPSSSNSVSPTPRVFKISGWGIFTR